MSTRLLQLAGILLIASSFSYVDRDLRVTEAVQLTRTHLLFRIMPTALVVALSIAATPRRVGRILWQMVSPPMLWWTWFAVVAIISGYLSNIAPNWSAWKCIELLVALFWASSIAVCSEQYQTDRILRSCFAAVLAISYVICIWAVLSATAAGLGQYLDGQRLEVEVPAINSINLSVISAFSIVGCWIYFRRVNPGFMLVLMALPLFVLLLSQARTGLIGLGLAGGYALVAHRISASYRLVLLLLLVGVAVAFFASEDLRKTFRMRDASELLRLSGRIESETGDSAWGECVRKIKESPLIGHGFLNMTRFMYGGKRVVGDNGFLHALVSAGFVGALPMMIFAVSLFVIWFRMGTIGFSSPSANQLFGFGSSATCIAFMKSLTTNSLTSSDYAFVLFLLSALAVKLLREPFDEYQPTLPRIA